jgi:hypothetical protein
MTFPAYIHSVRTSSDDAAWPVEAQGPYECGCTAASNALNILVGAPRFRKDDFVREAGLLFRPNVGTPSPMTGWLIQQHGFGTHFGNLAQTDYEVVLRDLIDRKIPVVIELGIGWTGPAWFGPVHIYGQHSVVLVGYSDPFHDGQGNLREEYYLVDSQWPNLGVMSLSTNDVDVDGDGKLEIFPGNRTMTREQLRADYPMKIYFPVFPTQEAHKSWYQANIRKGPSDIPLVADLVGELVTGSNDIWAGQ